MQKTSVPNAIDSTRLSDSTPINHTHVSTCPQVVLTVILPWTENLARPVKLILTSLPLPIRTETSCVLPLPASWLGASSSMTLLAAKLVSGTTLKQQTISAIVSPNTEIWLLSSLASGMT